MRIAVGGFLHESHSFAPRPTTYQDFLTPGGFPGLTQGDALLPTMRGNANAIGGAIATAEARGATLVPLAWCIANPAGPVQDDAFERIAAQICAPLAAATPVDGIYLDLHGAALADSYPDAEGELLRRVRAIVGPTPIAISLDPHANLTAAMVAHADAISPYLTYPHVDMQGAGARAMSLLMDTIRRGAPLAKAYRQIDFWTPITSQCTLMPPMAPVMDARLAIMARTRAAELAWCFGFPYADFPGCGAALAAYADTQAAADQAADALKADIDAREPGFAVPIPPADQAVAAALRAQGPGGPVIIADTQDNPGGGGHGDTTGLLSELVRQNARGAVVCLINDADSAAMCHAAGQGATIDLVLGGRSDGAPFRCTARVVRLADGNFTLTGPMSRGNPAVLGPMALVETPVEDGGVQVVIVSRKMQAYDQAILRHVGLDPAEIPILALKSSVHFRADFAPIARDIIVAAAPGPVVADPATLTFSNLRPGLRLRPGANA